MSTVLWYECALSTTSQRRRCHCRVVVGEWSGLLMPYMAVVVWPSTLAFLQLVAETEHVEFSRTRQTLLAPRAKRRGVLGESHEGVSCILRLSLIHI